MSFRPNRQCRRGIADAFDPAGFSAGKAQAVDPPVAIRVSLSRDVDDLLAVRGPQWRGLHHEIARDPPRNCGAVAQLQRIQVRLEVTRLTNEDQLPAVRSNGRIVIAQT